MISDERSTSEGKLTSERTSSNDNSSALADATLRYYIDGILNVDRRLANIAIGDAQTAGGNRQGITRATNELTEGDADVTSGKFEEAIMDYAEAWRTALLALRRS